MRDAFLTVSREHFVPEVDLEAAYRDQAVVTKQTESGLGLSSSSQPGIMAEMLDELGVEPGQRVLEIGAGTGYNAALLRHIVGPTGRVTTVDIDPDTAARARKALRGTGVRVVLGDGREGYRAGAPYDRIVVTASASQVPRAWREQLAPNGLLEVPLRVRNSAGLHLIPTLRRDGDRLRSVSVICGGFMPIRESPDDRAPYDPLLFAEWADGDSKNRLVGMSGALLRGASSRAARRLIRAICSEPVSRPLGMRARAKSIALYLTLRGPARRLVGAYDGREFMGGLADRQGASVALLPGWPTTSRILAFGGEDAADELEELVREWDELGRPGEKDVELSVNFKNGMSSIRTRWRGR